ncbi:MAG TPA: endopeptidase La, partial [Treponemataceae bacterium]|nr:endopeptidase La [Treponemataceae bacterium]
MEPNSSEYFVTRNFLETIIALPWMDSEPENYELDKALKILNKDHFGLEEVKKRIIEYLAVRKMKMDTKGSIILLVGPPGVGKTSVGRSIARAMKKPFFRFSVGGMRDEAEIKGHRRTYVGAMPGKIIQGLKISKNKSSVFMIDEVDKMGESYQGDPASALLEVLDPEQNMHFRDYYLDIPFDLSNVIFILTANTLDSIPGPLRDRVEIIRMSGYVDEEKYNIAKKYLLPKSLEKNGLRKGQVKYNKKELMYIANAYAREAGVRTLERNLDKIHRKYVTELVQKDGIHETMVKIDKLFDQGEDSEAEMLEKQMDEKLDAKKIMTIAEIEKYLGKPLFTPEEDQKVANRPGTAIGLAWTSLGGDTLKMEALAIPGKEGLKLTGKLGDVMKESAAIAMSWVRAYTIKNKIKPLTFFQKHTIHMHIPEGATPKDGPSAGITMVITMLSLLKNKKAKRQLAMTGELSLTGDVLSIGGLKEKTVAAKRNRIKTIVIPRQNMRDLDDIPEQVKKGIEFKPVSRIEEVIELAF